METRGTAPAATVSKQDGEVCMELEENLTEYGDGDPERKTVYEWRVLVKTFKMPLSRIMKPLHMLLKCKFCDPDAQALQEEFLDLHDRNYEASTKFLKYMLNEEGKSTQDLIVRWQLFESALESVHPNLYEIIKGKRSAEIDEMQKSLLNFFMEDISDCVDPGHLLPALFRERLLDQAECEQLRCLRDQKGPTLSAIYMVCNIHRSIPDWYHVFLKVLFKNGYKELVEKVDDDIYRKLVSRAQNGSDKEAQVGSATEESILEASGAAYVPRPSNYGAAPLPAPSSHDVPNNQPPSSASDAPADTENTGQKRLHRGSETESESEEDDFRSCESGSDDDDSFDITNIKHTKWQTDNTTCKTPVWNKCGASNTHLKYVNGNNTDDWEQIQIGKVLGGKNIVSSEEAPTPDNSNEDCDGSEQQGEMEDIQPEPLELRPYQEELARKGLNGRNVIIVAPTGSGKTHVALRLIQNHLDQPGRGIRKVVFLVNQVALAQQQYNACVKYLSRSNVRTKLVTGNAGAAATEKVPLKHLVMRADILVMTAQILVNALDQKELDGICQFSMVVFDECHHTNLLHPFNCIMHQYMDAKFSDDEDFHGQLPQVVGLTASVGVGKAGNQEQARKHIQKLCAHLDAHYICTVTEHSEQLAQYSNDPKYEQHLCAKRPDDEFQRLIEDVMRTIEEKMEKSEYINMEDTEVLREKLKLRPHIRGTSQYTGWVSEIMRNIAMLDDAEARRFLESSRRMLKFYNESLVINDECDTKDALDYLQSQLTEVYDTIGRRTTEIDVFLKDLFDKNLPYLETVSSLQANTNPKLMMLEELLAKAFEDEPQSRAMVFVKTRDLATGLQKWMIRRPQLKRLKPGKMVGAGPSADKGGMTKNQQVDVMEYFRSGDHKVMVATSVAEEGLDISKCNLVIRYNHVTNEIAMVQARGRARAENSQFMTLASYDKGVQAKEEVNFIREMMMHDAIKELQSEMSTSHFRFQREIKQIQKDEKTKRDAEREMRKGKQLRQGEVVFRCRNCDSFGFVSSDVRKIEGIHHIVKDLDYRERSIERLYPPKEYGQIQIHGRVYCKSCGEDWGPILQFQNVKFPCIRLEGFRLTDEFNRKDVPKKWKQTNFIVGQLEADELEAYRKEAIAVGYTL